MSIRTAILAAAIVAVAGCQAPRPPGQAQKQDPSAPVARISGQVITVGSLSKLAWGGLRVGWVRAARPIIDRLVAGKIVADHSSSLVTQAIGWCGSRVCSRRRRVRATRCS